MTTNSVRKVFGYRMALVGIAGMSLGLGGCSETDSFLYDPSVIGRWERTPTIVPIQTRLVAIEGPADEQLDYTDPTEADLVPEVYEHRIGPGDALIVTIYDLPNETQTVEYQREVDPRGLIELPQLGQIYINGMTAAGAEEAIKEAMKAYIARPTASVLVAGRRAERYSVMGGVQTPGNFRIPTSNFRLLEALSSAGTFMESADYVYIIRQVTLSDTASGRPGPSQPAPLPDGSNKTPSGEELIDAINRLTKPEQPRPEQPKPEQPKPEQPNPEPKLENLPPTEPPKPGSPGMLRPATQPTTQPSTQPSAQPTQPSVQPKDPPLVDLPPAPGDRVKAAPQPEVTAKEEGEMAWVNIDGKWVKVKRPRPDALSPLGRPSAGESQMTQRIIRVPMERLVNGDASVNIIVRAGDVIRVPSSPHGTIYIQGQVGRPGAYNVAEGITLLRIIPSAGGITGLAAPGRVDLIRQVGPEQQAMIRLNYGAIAEGTQPDIFLRGNDVINIGSTFWALPMAVIRNGFRMTYGFGFLADRNFGNDIFGPPPLNRFGQ